MKYCTFCGIPFTRSLNEEWIENVRAIWIEGTGWNRTAVSGVGRWGEYDDDSYVNLPADRQSHYDRESGPGPAVEVLRSDPYHVPGLVNAIEGAARLQNDVFLSRLEPTVQSLKNDSFSRLVPELLQNIVTLLPTSDVHSLRLASPVFATLELPERFWASRFQPGREYDHLPEVHDRPPQSWRALYHSLRIWTRGIPSMANRKRVWGLAKRLQATLSQLDGVSCKGDPLGTWFETISDGSDQNIHAADVSWHTASRAVAHLGKSFFYGSRVLRARALRFSEPVKLREMSVSFVDTAAGRFISGFNMIDEHNRSHVLGYQHEKTMSRISLSPDEPIQGWELAMDLCGIKGIAAVRGDGTLIGWAGESAGVPRWRLKGSQGVSAVKAEFDALKLVSLSRDKLPNQETWLNDCLWYPEVPREGLLFNGSRGDEPRAKYNLPLRTNLDRTVQTPEYPYGTDEGWTTVHGKGSQIIGMFATLSRPFWDLGLISI
ncbi:hypothetical protein H9Q73_014283 [Fusarium xylarioides]|nr:hypothetical protein H9Q73_014283 [Fusarium xylarioides]